MKVGLFIPCYIDQFFPRVGIATLELLEKLSCDVSYPTGQSCCGQPLANSGLEREMKALYASFANVFAHCDFIVSPSGSCTYHIRHHFNIIEQTDEVKHLREKTFELTEFLLDILEIRKLDAVFEARVGIHESCHGLRGLGLGKPSELNATEFSNMHALLDLVEGIRLCVPERRDECCGFGGTFSVNEPQLSIAMGQDCIERHLHNRVEYITASDMSCLMHLDGIIRKNRLPVKVMHIAEILNHTKGDAHEGI